MPVKSQFSTANGSGGVRKKMYFPLLRMIVVIVVLVVLRQGIRICNSAYVFQLEVKSRIIIFHYYGFAPFISLEHTSKHKDTVNSTDCASKKGCEAEIKENNRNGH
jgi:hypothetical protein